MAVLLTCVRQVRQCKQRLQFCIAGCRHRTWDSHSLQYVRRRRTVVRVWRLALRAEFHCIAKSVPVICLSTLQTPDGWGIGVASGWMEDRHQMASGQCGELEDCYQRIHRRWFQLECIVCQCVSLCSECRYSGHAVEQYCAVTLQVFQPLMKVYEVADHSNSRNSIICCWHAQLGWNVNFTFCGRQFTIPKCKKPGRVLT
jgi:hypothetical protein